MPPSDQSSGHGSADSEPSDQHNVQRLLPTVLVVDDDADIRESIADLLTDHGYAVVQADDGQEAHDYLTNQPVPSCVILDLWMPNLDGWSLASQVQQGRLPPVPILLVTAGSSDVGYPVPNRYVLRKPIEPQRLLKLVSELVRGRPKSPGA